MQKTSLTLRSSRPISTAHTTHQVPRVTYLGRIRLMELWSLVRQWNQSLMSKQIAVKELLPTVIAGAIWGHS